MALARAQGERAVLWLPAGFAAGAAWGAGPGAGAGLAGPAIVFALSTLMAFSLLTRGARAPLSAPARPALQALATLAAFIALVSSATAAGWSAVGLRAQAVAAPVAADMPAARTLAGVVEAVDRNRNGAWRATLRVEGLDGPAGAPPPVRARISLKESEPPLPGDRLSCRVRLRPPPGPAVPGGYDHARRAWFERLGAVGHALDPCRPLPAAASGPADWRAALVNAQRHVARWRAEAARKVVETAPGGGGGLLAAVLTGDRVWLGTADMEALQVSGLSHIVSVSGLHVALLGGMCFLAVWRGLALVGPLAMRVDPRKVAATVAIAATGAYAFFTGGEAPAVRAFVMAAIAFGAILIDRKAVTMRGLALAAFLVLAWRPESALDPGFQMSFLATAALVALWEMWEAGAPGRAARGTGPVGRAGSWLLAAAAASLVAGLATAPVAAATFHRLAPWGLPANLAAAPIVDFWVAPAALLGAALSPFGLGEPFLKLAAAGMDAILWLARAMAGWPGAGLSAPWSGPWPPALIVSGILWAALWRGRLRLGGLALVAAGLAAWATAPRVVGWIAPEGRAMLMTPSDGLDPELCQSAGARFDASRLIDAAGLPQSDADRLLPPGRHGFRRGCALGEGDWSARHVRAEGGGADALALELDGKVHVAGPGDWPEGALVLREGTRVRLHAPRPPAAPWIRARSGDGGGAGSASDPR